MAELIVPLDTPTQHDALELVDRLGERAGFYKVGLELYTRGGPGVVRALRGRGKRVFLDLKLHDIPNTVAGAVAAAVDLDVELLTLHAAGGAAMFRAAADAADGGLRLLAVTLLTSLDAPTVGRLWNREGLELEAEVLRLARLADDWGADGLVSSALEAHALRQALGPEIVLVTPGIRLAGGDRHDQARVTTPGEAVAAGADYLVVGRAITGAADPQAALDRVLAEMEGAG
jgi:orotidine-5'-phosphate decarboxylase